LDINGTQKFTLNAGIANMNWISVPYTLAGVDAVAGLNAFDLVTMIEGGTGASTNTKISQVIKWNAATQGNSIASYNAVQNKWLGDFTINPGDAIAFNVKSSFNWNIPLMQNPQPANWYNDP